MKIAVLMIVCACAALAQSIDVTPGVPASGPTPAKMVMISAGARLSCTLIGDTFPATNIAVRCTEAGAAYLDRTYSLQPNRAITMQYTVLNAGAVTDALTFTITASATGSLSVDAAAEVAGPGKKLSF